MKLRTVILWIVIFATAAVFALGSYFRMQNARVTAEKDARFVTLTVGMTADEVKSVMGDEDPIRRDRAAFAEKLTAGERSATIYTLTFLTHVWVDPSYDCYFDKDDRLVAKNRAD